MRLLMLTQYFPPEMGAPQGRLSELGERLIKLGWEVEALTALPNYPTGKIFDGYAPFEARVEHVGNIRTVRTPIWPSQSGFAKRIASYFSFVASASRYGPKLCTDPDLIMVESPPLFLVYAAWYLSRRFRCPYVMNVSDLWPESAVRMGIVPANHPGVRIAEDLEWRSYRKAAAVTGQSQEIIDGVRKLSPFTLTHVVTNGVDPDRFGPHRADEEARRLLGGAPGPIFIFAGLLGLAQGLDQILDVAARLPPDMPGRFVLVGDGPVREALDARIRAENLKRVRIIPPVPRDRVPALLACADVALVTLGMRIPGAVPSKIYEAMAASLPLIIVADGEPAERVLRAQAGLSATPGDTTGLERAVRRMIEEPAARAKWGAAGRHAAETTYHRTAIAEDLSRFLRTLI